MWCSTHPVCRRRTRGPSRRRWAAAGAAGAGPAPTCGSAAPRRGRRGRCWRTRCGCSAGAAASTPAHATPQLERPPGAGSQAHSALTLILLAMGVLSCRASSVASRNIGKFAIAATSRSSSAPVASRSLDIVFLPPGSSLRFAELISARSRYNNKYNYK